jgi:hypothetical protein
MACAGAPQRTIPGASQAHRRNSGARAPRGPCCWGPDGRRFILSPRFSEALHGPVIAGRASALGSGGVQTGSNCACEGKRLTGSLGHQPVLGCHEHVDHGGRLVRVWAAAALQVFWPHRLMSSRRGCRAKQDSQPRRRSARPIAKAGPAGELGGVVWQRASLGSWRSR